MANLDANTEILVRFETEEQREIFQRYMRTKGLDDIMFYMSNLPAKMEAPNDYLLEEKDVDADITIINFSRETNIG